MKPSTRMLVFVLACLAYQSACGQDLTSQHGSCSRKCISHNLEQAAGNLLPFPCSCSPSCAVYRDCCYDSPYRNEETKHDTTQTMCLSLSGKGHYRAVSGCPRDWPQSHRFCAGSIGHMPPVTSRTTGTTYANVYCAVCNGEESNLKTWDVELQCCPEHEGSDDKRYVYEKGHLWSVVSEHNKCLCRYRARGHDLDILQNLELRSCDDRAEISKCSSHTNITHQEQQQCSSFLDPVYVGGKLYRNRFCAKCNFRKENTARCMPQIVEAMFSIGMTAKDIHKFCAQHSVTDCIYYFDVFGRGQAHPFSNILNTNVESCMPPPGRRCCRGERYDFRTKQCRKTTRRSKRLV